MGDAKSVRCPRCGKHTENIYGLAKVFCGYCGQPIVVDAKRLEGGADKKGQKKLANFLALAKKAHRSGNISGGIAQCEQALIIEPTNEKVLLELFKLCRDGYAEFEELYGELHERTREAEQRYIKEKHIGSQSRRLAAQDAYRRAKATRDQAMNALEQLRMKGPLCPKCMGSGKLDAGEQVVCPDCKSSGECAKCGGLGRIGMKSPKMCPYCKGSGQCKYCDGDGYRKRADVPGAVFCPMCRGTGRDPPLRLQLRLIQKRKDIMEKQDALERSVRAMMANYKKGLMTERNFKKMKKTYIVKAKKLEREMAALGEG